MVTYKKKELYDVGDKVKIIPEIDPDEDYDVSIADEMPQYAGSILTIEEIEYGDEYDEDPTYKVEQNGWSWSSDLFEGVVVPIKLSKKARTKKIIQIIKEIKSNNEFSKCFKDIDKEVNEWSDYQIAKWQEN